MPGWFRSADPGRLGQAIVKAQQCSVDAALIRKAESALEKAKASYLPRSPSVSAGALRGPWPRGPQPRRLPPRLTYAANFLLCTRLLFRSRAVLARVLRVPRAGAGGGGASCDERLSTPKLSEMAAKS